MIAFRFNTSYVNVYQSTGKPVGGGKIVSIHPMLMFISTLHRQALQRNCFNTSYVNVYPTYFRHF